MSFSCADGYTLDGIDMATCVDTHIVDSLFQNITLPSCYSKFLFVMFGRCAP